MNEPLTDSYAFEGHAQWAATWTWTWIKILEFFFLNELWQFNKHSLKPRNPKFHKILIKTF